jgi:hypothetical protein
MVRPTRRTIKLSGGALGHYFGFGLGSVAIESLEHLVSLRFIPFNLVLGLCPAAATWWLEFCLNHLIHSITVAERGLILPRLLLGRL